MRLSERLRRKYLRLRFYRRKKTDKLIWRRPCKVRKPRRKPKHKF